VSVKPAQPGAERLAELLLRSGRRVDFERLEPLTRNVFNSASGGVWRLRDETGGQVLKVLHPPTADSSDRGEWAASADPGHWNYWRREAHVYQSELPRRHWSAHGLRGPESLGLTELETGSLVIWLEEVRGTPGVLAGAGALIEVGRRLGRAQAARLGKTLPEPWLAADWLRDYVASRQVAAELDWRHPVAREAWPAALRADLSWLWDNRDELLAATDKLPRTLCHHDVWPMNVVFDAAGPVLLDWAFVGPGPVGEDAANLILDSFLDGLIDLEHFEALHDGVLAAYSGAFGDTLDPRAVRRAIMITGAAKYCWLAPRMLTWLERSLRNPGLAAYDTRSAPERFAGRVRVLTAIAHWGRAALDG
jgi:hypothetical protein